MNKTELEQIIKNGESVWLGLCDKIDLNRYLIELKPNMIASKEFKNELGLPENRDIGEWQITIANTIEITSFPNGTKYGFSIYDIYKNKQTAKHMAFHKGITRIEQLPFLTWEEFLENKNFEFFDKNGILTWLYINTSKTSESIHLNNRFEKLNDWDLTEANFYKAYDECVRLFRGG